MRKPSYSSADRRVRDRAATRSRRRRPRPSGTPADPSPARSPRRRRAACPTEPSRSNSCCRAHTSALWPLTMNGKSPNTPTGRSFHPRPLPLLVGNPLQVGVVANLPLETLRARRRAPIGRGLRRPGSHSRQWRPPCSSCSARNRRSRRATSARAPRTSRSAAVAAIAGSPQVLGKPRERAPQRATLQRPHDGVVDARRAAAPARAPPDPRIGAHRRPPPPSRRRLRRR